MRFGWARLCWWLPAPSSYGRYGRVCMGGIERALHNSTLFRAKTYTKITWQTSVAPTNTAAIITMWFISALFRSELDYIIRRAGPWFRSAPPKCPVQALRCGFAARLTDAARGRFGIFRTNFRPSAIASPRKARAVSTVPAGCASFSASASKCRGASRWSLTARPPGIAGRLAPPGS
jgi:hypothetical protein